MVWGGGRFVLKERCKLLKSNLKIWNKESFDFLKSTISQKKFKIERLDGWMIILDLRRKKSSEETHDMLNY